MRKTLTICLATALFLFFIISADYAKQKKPWRVPGDFATIQQAIGSPEVADGDVIIVGPGSHAGAVIDRPVTIKGVGKAMITSGVHYGGSWPQLTTAFRLDAGADGTEISHLMIPNDFNNWYFFAVFSRGVDDVSIHHLTITNSIQAISNYNGNNWDISYNKITGTNPYSGGGIGIMINAWDPSTSDQTGIVANYNFIAFNTTEGVVDVIDYSGPGILLSSGHGASQIPGGTLTGNIIYKNKCTHTGANGVGFETDDVPWETTDPHDPAITSNTVAFNDFRGSTVPLVWYGDTSVNNISRNLGVDDNRGEGKEGWTPREIFH